MFNKGLEYLNYFQKGLKTCQSNVNVNVLWLLQLKYSYFLCMLSLTGSSFKPVPQLAKVADPPEIDLDL